MLELARTAPWEYSADFIERLLAEKRRVKEARPLQPAPAKKETIPPASH
jgi:hypothetical protein